MNFIPIEYHGRRSTRTQRQIHSHAARVSHARARLSRVAEYNRQKAKHSLQEAVAEQTLLVETSSPKIWDATLPKIVSGAFEPEPLANFLKSLTSWENALFDYYIRVVVPSLQTGCGMFMLVENQPNFIRDWLLYASTDIDILKTALLTACRHRSAFNSDTEYELRATQYKIKQVQAIRKGITEDSTPARRTAITRAIMLALDEIYLNDLSMASRHVTGAVRIIQASGGADVLGLTSLVRYLIGASVFGKGLLEEDPSLQGIRSHLKTDLLRF